MLKLIYAYKNQSIIELQFLLNQKQLISVLLILNFCLLQNLFLPLRTQSIYTTNTK